MCGICGFSGGENKGLLKEMITSMLHRGPDDYGYYSDGKFNLGHRRLSIIDLSKRGKQPMFNEDKSIALVYNGEIYNFRELRKELEGKGHSFFSNSDSETILHAYEEYGNRCVEYLDGDFAFAVYDSKNKKLFLARDRLGVKPLYYAVIDGEFFFASEIKAILQNKDFKKEIDLQSLHDLLTFRYVPEPNTILKGVRKLLPGHYLVYQNKKVNIFPYWVYSIAPQKQSEAFYLREFQRRFSDAVKKRLISDVPLGAYLSGGIDSSSVVSVMTDLSDQVKTFTIGFDIRGFRDEIEPARKVADYLNTDHHEFIVKEDPFEILPQIIWHLDEPIADPVGLPTFLLSKYVKKHVTVALVGEGSDECFAGYEHNKLMLLANRYSRILPRPVKSFIPLMLNAVPDRLLDFLFRYTSELGEEGKKRFAEYIKNFNAAPQDYLTINAIFSEAEKKNLYSNKLQNISLEKSVKIIEPFFKSKDLLTNILTFDTRIALLHLLVKGDKVSMAHGVEIRIPFLDTKVVELAASLPNNVKLSGLTDKYIVRKAMRKKLPRFVLKRKKQRFFVPIHYWFEEILNKEAGVIFSRSSIEDRGYFKYDYIKRILDRYNKSRLYYGRQLWNLLNFEIWCKVFLDQENISKPVLDIKKLF